MRPELAGWKIVLGGILFCAALWVVVAWGPNSLLRFYASHSQATPGLVSGEYGDAHAQVMTLTETATSSAPLVIENIATTSPEGMVPYIEVVESCDYAYQGKCVHMRSAPSLGAPIVANLRTGIVLKVAQEVVVDGQGWYRIAVDNTLFHPERVTTDWYVATSTVQLFYDPGDNFTPPEVATTTKLIIVNRAEEMLYAYEGSTLFMSEHISTGRELTPTPAGTFEIYKKTPSRYMQGPIPGQTDQEYDLPGVPWNMYFTHDGAVIHGAYWHDNFGRPWSHGCVNLPLESAKKLYEWAPVGTIVIVQD